MAKWGWAFNGILFFMGSQSALAYEFTPDRHAVPLSPSVVVEGQLSDHVEFLYNRGKGSISFRDYFLEKIQPNAIRGLAGFQSFKKTRLDLSAYEIRLMELIPALDELLALGIQLRCVSDPSTFMPFQALSPAEFEALNESDQQNYLRAYDRNGDRRVNAEDEALINGERLVSIEVHKHLQVLSEKYPGQVELIHPPVEWLSKSVLLPFPRLHHLKSFSLDFLKKDEWHSQWSLVSSANLTDSCANRRIAQSEGNKLRYTTGLLAETNYAKGSQGNVQFGAMLRGDALLRLLQGPKEAWFQLYKKQKHFDEGQMRETLLPRFVIEDPRGFRSTLETFYSEGTKATNRRAVDPVLAALHHLSGPEKKLRVHYSTQFVSTHSSKNQALRFLIQKAGSQMEDFFVLVDGNFATQPYSSLPQLAFAPLVSLQFGTLQGKSIRDLPKLPEHLPWEKHIGVYEGARDVYGAPGDKLHAKVDYYEYLDSNQERHYLVVWGSANSSKNASKGNADVLHVLDSTDPSVGKQVKKYFSALRSDPRVFPYSLAYLDRKLREAFHWDQKILHEDFLQKFAQLLSQAPDAKMDLPGLTKTLSKVKAHSEFGKNLLLILKWYQKNVSQPLSWADFYLMLEISHPQKLLPEAFFLDLASRWNLAKGSSVDSLKRALGRLEKANFGTLTHNMARILNNCSSYLSRLGVHKNPATLFSVVHP